MVTQNPDKWGTETPFATGAPMYRAAGWAGTLPLPDGKKHPPPTGWTDKAAPYPNADQTAQWIEQRATGNICLRLAGVDAEHEVIGIDVDHYVKGGKAKTGGDTLAEIERQLDCQLPAAWTSSARTDGVSGIRYFRVPRGLQWRDDLKDIDIICKGHRYADVWPSINPDADNAVYWWFPPGTALTADGRRVWNGEIPRATAIVELPDSWVDYLTQGRKAFSVDAIDLAATNDEIYRWADSTLPDGSAEAMCERMRQAVADRKAEVDADTDSHRQIVRGLAEIVRLAEEGHTGWAAAFNEVESYCATDVSKRAKRDTARTLTGEIRRARTGMLRKSKGRVESVRAVGAEYPPRWCVCAAEMQTDTKTVRKFAKRLAKLTRSKKSSPASAPASVNPAGREVHSGHVRIAYRLARRYENQLLFVDRVGWHYWNGSCWTPDDRGKAKQAVIAVLKDSWTEAFSLTDTAAQKRLIADTKASSSAAGIAGVLSVAAALEPFAATVSDLDTDPYLLNVANGRVDLNTFAIKPHDASDKMTKTCRGTFDPETVVEGSLWMSS
ncbi:bifunctional DNA primase/polymerase [Mycolicibacterium farcinogenes]|nr:bifunctional DNA primase/polymerase [Mycolicibacterium farcinogenes]